ncbi:MAG: hypothetical protein GXO82_07530 [Chlorobi bacterium]|nr:hypothetical protein [Chlorobiota bacterium]
MAELNPYFEAIHNRVCVICMEMNEEGECTVHGGDPCIVRKYLPRIVDIVNRTRSAILEDYLVQFRDVVCASCSPGGENECVFRDESACVLDRYYALIVEAIQDVPFRKVS